ncbi:hypothetical protein A6A06_17215 [Streptomyces sp. CB02923]|uniref:DUF6083 domain-containing protein n=1 Tax=Streptomyces sp. CB02923 TaxID=1718985 RepID=UPI00093CDCE2|nr:DUF6083 domain-containing protein [Streptomyces sp. CB02923]OKI00690.1 hypothetical protein A6A06_17215 [Streptomyces sp. CB02923]
MGDISEPRTCRGCRAVDDSTTWRGHPFGALCGTCWTRTAAGIDHEQAEAEGSDAPAPPAPPACRACGREQDRFPTGYGHWVLLEPEVQPAALDVPEGHRWVIGHDGCAVNRVGGSPPPCCRIAHRPVCARSPRPAELPRIFLAVWELNAGYERRVRGRDAPPSTETPPFTGEADDRAGDRPGRMPHNPPACPW